MQMLTFLHLEGVYTPNGKSVPNLCFMHLESVYTLGGKSVLNGSFNVQKLAHLHAVWRAGKKSMPVHVMIKKTQNSFGVHAFYQVWRSFLRLWVKSGFCPQKAEQVWCICRRLSSVFCSFFFLDSLISVFDLEHLILHHNPLFYSIIFSFS